MGKEKVIKKGTKVCPAVSYTVDVHDPNCPLDKFVHVDTDMEGYVVDHWGMGVIVDYYGVEVYVEYDDIEDGTFFIPEPRLKLLE
jgi:hypothetical protein